MAHQARIPRMPDIISTHPRSETACGLEGHSHGRPNVNRTGPLRLERRIRLVVPLVPPTTPHSKHLPVLLIKHPLINTGEKFLSNDLVALVTEMIRIHEDLFLITDSVEYA